MIIIITIKIATKKKIKKFNAISSFSAWTKFMVLKNNNDKNKKLKQFIFGSI